MDKVKIIECPRDAWQGLEKIIPADAKAAYLAKLIKAGFRHLDAVSFVAPKYVPQMADSEAVMHSLAKTVLKPNGSATKAEIIGVLVNAKGLARARAAPGVTTLGYPYSISAHFRRTNTNMSQSESRLFVEKIHLETERAVGGYQGRGDAMVGCRHQQPPWTPAATTTPPPQAGRGRAGAAPAAG